MKVIHDIRQQIPQFSANFFAPYVYQPYPRMMVNKESGKPYLDATKKAIVVDSEAEESAFWASKTSSVPVVAAPKAIDIPAEQPLVVQPMAVVAEAEPKRRGRPPANKLPADLK